MVLNSGVYTFTAPDGTIATFLQSQSSARPIRASEGVVNTVIRPNGERLDFTYLVDGTTRALRSVRNNYGYQVHIEYSSSGPMAGPSRVTAFNTAIDACSPSATTCTFTRAWPSLTFARSPATGAAHTWAVTDTLGQTLSLNTGGGLLNQIIRSNGQVLTFTWTYPRQVATLVDGAGTWTYTFPPHGGLWGHSVMNTVSDPLGYAVGYTFYWSDMLDGSGGYPHLRSITNSLGQVTEMIQDAGGLHSVLYPEGDRIVISRNDHGNITSIARHAKAASGLASVQTILNYPTTCVGHVLCRRPLSVTDARGNVTHFTYDAAGNLLTETGPAATPGAARPQTRYTWEQRYAWYKQNGSSSITQAPSPVWVQTGSVSCMTGATC